MSSIDIIDDNTDDFLDGMKRAIAAGLEEVGLVAERYAKEELSKPKPHRSKPTPRPNVDTGRLRNSVTHAIDGGEMAAYIGTNVEYGPYIELGTSKAPAYPFLVPAAQNHASEYRDIIEKHLNNG